MDDAHLDALAKTLAARLSRRKALRRLGPGGFGAALLTAVGIRPVAAQDDGDCTSRGCRCNGGVQNNCDAGLTCCPDNPGLPGGPGRCVREGNCNPPNCTSEGCACHSGTRDACDDGLVCCADDSSMPGGPGRCETADVCFGNQCQATTNPCPSDCNPGAYCADCCSGYCGDDDHCGPPPCDGVGCECMTGTQAPCGDRLVCCPSSPGLPGGPGQCTTPDNCPS